MANLMVNLGYHIPKEVHVEFGYHITDLKVNLGIFLNKYALNLGTT
jgi:hypothetical protein